MNKPTHFDHRSTRVVVVGGGPIGIEMAVALKRLGVDVRIIEAGSIGHTMSWWAPQTHWFSSNERISIAGVPLLTADQSKATREEYLTYLRSIVVQFDLPIQTYEKVTGVEQTPQGQWIVQSRPNRSTSTEFAGTDVHDEWISANTIVSENEVTCDAIVLAIGGTDFPKRLNIPGEGLPHVDAYLREPHRYYQRRVLIVGGRNSAVEAALRLHHAGARVSISYRGDELPTASIKYWLTPEILGLIKSGRIEAFFGTIPHSITPSDVTLQRVSDGSLSQVSADDVLMLVGYEQDKALFRQCGVELDGEMQRPLLDHSTMQTNQPRIYVAGTAVAGTQSSKYKTFLENCHDHVDSIIADLQNQGLIPHTQARMLFAQNASGPRIYDDQARLDPES